jgi:hypothetical protein
MHGLAMVLVASLSTPQHLLTAVPLRVTSRGSCLDCLGTAGKVMHGLGCLLATGFEAAVTLFVVTSLEQLLVMR